MPTLLTVKNVQLKLTTSQGARGDSGRVAGASTGGDRSLTEDEAYEMA